MRDSLDDTPVPIGPTDASKADALHALGSFYVRQGFPRQGLSLLLASRKFAEPSLELSRAIAHAYVLAGAPQKALALLDAMGPALRTDSLRRAAAHLRARALLALGRVREAREAFAESGVRHGMKPAPKRHPA